MADRDDNRGPKRPLRRVLLSLAPLGLVLAGCADDAELDSLEPQSPIARDIDKLFNAVMIPAAIVLVLVGGITLYMAWKFRANRYSEDEWPEQIEGHNKLEWGWTIVPAIGLAVMAVFSTAFHFDLNSDDGNPITLQVAGESVEWEPTVVVVGQQWWWEFRYYFDGIDVSEIDHADDLPPADLVTATQMVVPAGEEIELFITSRDVIHSFWIPALNGKRDAVPGLFSPWKLDSDVPGVYFGTCTEFCGLSHSRMQMQVVALTADEFQAWVTEQMSPYELAADADPAVARGAEVFVGQCSSCHLIDGLNNDVYDPAEVALVPGVAPDLTHFATRTRFAGGTLTLYNEDGSLNVNDLERWLRDPEEVKDMAPGEGRGMPDLGLSEDQIDDLVAFLDTTGDPINPSIVEQSHAD